MLRKEWDEYVIDRELTGKLAIESNAELQEDVEELEGSLNRSIRAYWELLKKYNRLEKEHKSLQVEHSRLLFDMDAVIENEVKVKYKKLQEENKILKELIRKATEYVK